MRATQGTLIECDPAIKAIIVSIENKFDVKFILEELDDQHILISSKQLDWVKMKLEIALKETRFNDSDDESGADDGNAGG